MNNKKGRYDTVMLQLLIAERCGMDDFIHGMRLSQARIQRLLSGEAEFRQCEMIRAAQLLKLCSAEFTLCFFLSN